MKPTIAFVWQGISDPTIYSGWRDGLYKAIVRLKKRGYKITFHEPSDKIEEDIILYWEAPCTANGKHADWYNNVRSHPQKKALLFAGGPISLDTIDGFDLFFTESQINDDEFRALGKQYIRAFGINEELFYHEKAKKKYEAILHATFAGWKRHELFAEALGEQGLAVGKVQKDDRNGYNRCVDKGVQILGEKSHKEVGQLLRESWVLVNTAEYWGGGQRATLEAMACGTPAIVMQDSPKNKEYVGECAGGLIVSPDPEAIKNGIYVIKRAYGHFSRRAKNYVLQKWTSKHYADNLEKGIQQLI